MNSLGGKGRVYMEVDNKSIFWLSKNLEIIYSYFSIFKSEYMGLVLDKIVLIGK